MAVFLQNHERNRVERFFNKLKQFRRIAPREHGLRVGLYHSLNKWYDQPDSVVALEDLVAYENLIAATQAHP